MPRRVLLQVDEFPGMVVEQGGVKSLHAFVLQVDAGIEVERYDGLLSHEKFFGLLKQFEPFRGQT